MLTDSNVKLILTLTCVMVWYTISIDLLFIVSVNLSIWLDNLIIKKILRNIINTFRSGCLNLQYAKSFHPNIMIFTAFTKLDLGLLYMKLLSNWSISLICYNFTLAYYLRISRPSFRCSLNFTLSINIEYICYFAYRTHILYFIVIIYLVLILAFYQKSCNFI